MSNFTQRLLLFLIGLPLLLFVIVYFDRFDHAGWASLVVLFTLPAAHETVGLFDAAYPVWRRRFVAPAAMLLPLAAYLELKVFPGRELVLPVLVFSALAIVTVELLHWKAGEPGLFTRRSLAGLGVLLYPGFLMTYPIRFISFHDSIPVILLFLLLNFGNDTFAYIFGMLLGKYSIRIVPVSPKKTLIGFIGGFAGTLLIGWIFFLLSPSLFAYGYLPTVPFFLLIGLCANTGDLVESAFKRAAAMKDSGRLMPGRGGLMDSLDSLLFSAPFFYYIGTILLN